ncbi:hypothetical protein LT679_09215 [Mucilaginibacter roseus]|uniref:Uncharacterized protein n=1 Tax=Mucilaginibacter roseus TaxID=1528868 RepID=A0ABS8U4K9_9SPHI|nr:hypothetical protein [Mucilaginibacter roseus]MCD8740777.1 hypothetical protein [Mucilaginibacter roseus]
MGETTNSKKCRIVNPEVINLVHDKKAGILNAYKDDIIIIENKALGYTIRYSLTNFSYQIEQDNASFLGNGAFEELPADEKQKEDWEAARVKAYHGSIMHFFRGLYKGDARREGFISLACSHSLAGLCFQCRPQCFHIITNFLVFYPGVI